MRAGLIAPFRFALTGLLMLMLAACQAPSSPSQEANEGAADSAPAIGEPAPGPIAKPEQPAPPPPAPPPPSPTDPAEAELPSDIGASSPSIRGRIGEGDAAAGELPMAGQERSRPMPGDGPSGVDPNRVMTPVLVELLPQEARQPRQGGSAVVLLAWQGAAMDGRRNMALCRELFLRFDQATTDEVGVGVRSGPDGETQLLRPLYWPTRQTLGPTTGADRCAQRLDTYDFPRAERIRRKFGLSGSGPYLVVERADMTSTERVAAVIDLSRARPEEIAGVVRYFRDGFMQSADVWDRSRFQTTRTRQEMRQSLGADVAASLLPTLVRTTRNVGCALTSLVDACEGAAPAQ